MPARLVRSVLVVAAALLAGVLGRALLSDAGDVTLATQPVAAPGPSPTAQLGPTWSESGATETDASGAVVVHVVGRVRRPGLVTLAPGDRVADAVAAAGGPAGSAALGRINLARRPVDGEQILVPGPDDPLPPVAAGPGPGSAQQPGAPTGLVNLNTASQAELEELPGVGPVTAGRILAWRQAHQRFTRVDELGEVAGIGPKTLARLRPLVTV